MVDRRLSELTQDGGFREKVAAVLSDLSARSAAKIYATKRTLSEELEKMHLGLSHNTHPENSYHVRRGSDDGAMAADVAGEMHAWNVTRRFWWMLGSSAMAHGLGWGGLFGLDIAQKTRVVKAILTLREAGWPAFHPLYGVHFGFDPAHLQTAVNWP